MYQSIYFGPLGSEMKVDNEKLKYLKLSGNSKVN
jgi:hypothetical protein